MQVGNAFKTIATRITKAETTDLSDEDVKAISKIEEAYKSVGIEIRKNATEFRNLDDILYELSGKWSTLTDIQKSNISYLSAGVRQTNIFKALMENMGRAQELTNEAMQGYGTTLRANEKYMNSYTGKMNTLKGVWQEFASSLVESDSIKSFIDMLTGLISVLDTFSPILTPIITMAIPMLVGGFVNATLSAINTEQSFSALILKLTGFDIQAKKTATTNIALASSFKTVGDRASLAGKLTSASAAGLKVYDGAAKSSTASTVATGAALTTAGGGAGKFAAAMGVASKAVTMFSVALGAAMVIIPIVKNIWDYFTLSAAEAAENVENLTKQIEEFNDSAEESKKASDAISTITDALAKYGDIPLKNMPTKEVQDYKDAIDKLRSLYPELTSAWTTYADVKKEDLDIINEKLRLNNELEAKKLQISLEGDRKSVEKTNKELNKKADEIIEQRQYIASLEKELAELEAIGMENLNTDQKMRYQDIVDALPNLSEKLSSAISDAEGLNETIANFLEQARILKENGIEVDIEGIKTLNELLIEKGFLDAEPVEAEVEVDLRTKIINGIGDVVKEIVDEADGSVVTQFEIDLRADISAFKDAEKAAQDIYDVMQLIVNAQDELNQTGMLEQSTINSLAEHYSSIYGIANDRVALQQFLNSAYTEEEGHMQTQIDLMNQYYEAMLMNDSIFYQTKVLNNENFTNFAAQLNAFLVKNGGEQYALDAGNFENLAQFKIEALKSVMQWIQECGINEENLLNQTVDLLKLLGGIDSGLTPIKFDMPKIKAPSRPKSTYKAPSSNKKKSSSKKSEKEVADLKLKINLFYKWEKAIKDVEHQMAKLDKVIESGTGQQKVAAMKKQIELYKELGKQQKALYQAQKKELARLQKLISNKGFRVEDNGTVVNYTEKLKSLEKWANSATGEEKEKRKEEVQAIKELLDSYTDLVDKMNNTELEIDSIDGNIKDKQQELKDYYNDLLDVVSDVESEITDMIKKELDKRKEAMQKAYEKQIELLEKAKKAYQEQNEEEDYQEEHDKKKNEIMELQNAINIAMKDTSLAGKKQLAELQKKMEEAKAELAQMEKDKNRQDQEKWFDDEMEKLEEEQAKKEEEWDEKYDDKYIAELVKDIIGQGFTTIEGQVIDLTELMTENFTDGIGLIGDALQSEFLDKLEQAKEIASNLSNIFKEIGVNLNPRESLTSTVSQSVNSAVQSASVALSGEISSYLRAGVKATPYQNNSSMSIGSLLQVNGNIDRAVLPNIEDLVNKAVDKMQASMKKQFRLGTGRI